MLKLYIILAFLSMHCCAAHGQRRIEIRLVEESKKVPLDNDFKIYLMALDSTQTDQILECPIAKNTITLPPAKGCTVNYVIFQHDHSSVRLPVKKLSLEQNMRWEFTVDRKPYSKQYYTPRADEQDTEAVLVLLVQPLPSGSPYEYSVAVTDMKSLRKEVEGVVKKAKK